MADQKIEFEVTIERLSFKFKGTKEMGPAIQRGVNQTISRMLETQADVMALTNGEVVAQVAEPPATNGHGTNGHTTEVQPRTRARRTNPVPVTDLLRGLKDDGYFTEARSANSILDKLNEKGFKVTPQTLSGRLQGLTQKVELHRIKADDGYIYKDTPFDESQRAANTPVESAE